MQHPGVMMKEVHFWGLTVVCVWFGKPRGGDSGMAELTCSAVIVSGFFAREDVTGMCPVAWGLLLLGSSLLPPCKSQTTDGTFWGAMSEL